MLTNEYRSNIDIKLYPSIDIGISQEYITENDAENYLIADFLLSSDTISNTTWDGASVDSIICDENHIESGRLDAENFIIQTISGDTYCYNLSGSTFNGGFYQGYYKAEGYDYQVLPNRYISGVTFEFVINDQDLNNECEIPRLNDVYTQNEGFLFYYGLKQENPYCSRLYTGVSCEDIPYQLDYNDVTVYPWEEQNPFLYYTEDNVCNEMISYVYEYPDCCDSIAQNALGVRITDEGKINVRFIDYSGSCVSGYTENDMVIKDYTTDQAHIEKNKKHHFVLKFQNISYDSECDLYKDRGLMELSVWVDGNLIFCEKVPELYAYALNLHRSVQIGIPYNISIGGGTLGNIENDAEIIDYNETGCTHTFCFGEDHGGFIGYKIKGADPIYFDEPINENIKQQLENIFSGDIEFYLEGKNCKVYRGQIDNNEQIEKLLFENFEVTLKITKCYKIISYEPCDVLENYFAGSFIGEIDLFKIYNKALNVQQIKKMAAQHIDMPTTCC